ncbi:MAG: N-(5'-phosphoribosyl)anthranilate isomerase [Rhodobacteraceae bacterium]|nr:N-(5'-phosphoribosyl)anthranilate isomerase [Paracoccaceae bacterium]
MQSLTRQSTPEAWIDLIFSAQAVARGAVVRRKATWVAREIGRDRFIAEVRQRGFHLVETGGQLIVICNPGGLRVIC